MEDKTTYKPSELAAAILAIPGGASSADEITYDNTQSGLSATNVQEAIDELANYISEEKPRIYGFYINSEESDPYTKVTYLGDAIGMTPAYMDYANDVFNWGSWANAWFLPRPCMLKFDGTVDYYLNPDDYTKKLDGTDSDIADVNYNGNAMMEWGRNGKKIWYKVIPYSGGTSAAFYVADHQVDVGYHAYSFINKNGDMVDHFYTPIYNGSVDGSNRIRSISGLATSKSLTASVEQTYCRANGEGWDTEVYCDIILINILLTLLTKTTDGQTAIGQGLVDSGTEAINNGFRTGVHNGKGLFYGTNSGAAATYTNAVKVFGMENLWGFAWRRFGGMVNVNGTIKYKLTRGTQDGSTAADYVVSTTAADYNGYLTGAALPSANGTYIQTMKWEESGAHTPTTAEGSATTHYCDGLWTNNSQVNYVFHGGPSAHSARCGPWCLDLNNAASNASWAVAAAPSFKPLS